MDRNPNHGRRLSHQVDEADVLFEGTEGVCADSEHSPLSKYLFSMNIVSTPEK